MAEALVSTNERAYYYRLQLECGEGWDDNNLSEAKKKKVE